MRVSRLTPPALAKIWGVSAESVLGLIRNGQLRAVNISKGQKPRYLIAAEDAREFELRRETRTAAKSKPQPLPVSPGGKVYL